MFRRANSIAYRYRVVASDPDKSQTDLSLRKRFEVNLSSRCWRQYRLQNFGNYLKLSPLFFLLLQTLLPPAPSSSSPPLTLGYSIRLIYSYEGCSFLDGTPIENDLHYTPETSSPAFPCARRHLFFLERLSRYLSIYTYFFSTAFEANDRFPGFRIKVSLCISESLFR